MLTEIDDFKCAGRNPALRENAKPCKPPAQGDFATTAMSASARRFSGGGHAIFDFREPARDGLPSWLDLSGIELRDRDPGDVLAIPVGDGRWAYAGDLSRLYRAWIGDRQGAIDAATVSRIDGALRAALDL